MVFAFLSFGPHLAVLIVYSWLCTRNYSWHARGTIWEAGDRTWVEQMQGKHPTYYTVYLAP